MGIEAYCVKCKKSVEMKDAVETRAKNNKKMLKGKCSVCGTTVCKFIK